ncbi:MAG: dual specificity protein phosphatase family protein [Planctomycetota bacterium]
MSDAMKRVGVFCRVMIARLTFVPTLAWNFFLARVLRLRRWWDEIDPRVTMGAFPFWFDVPHMARAGIGGVVNTCEEYAGPVSAYRQAGIEQLRIPTVDFTSPTLEDVERGVAFMQRQIAQGRGVYVHCKAGRARSGTVVLCYLISAKGMTPEQAQQRILHRRPHANPRLSRRPVVLEFWKKHGGDGIDVPEG